MGKKPAIRFEGYTADWEQRKLNDLVAYRSSNLTAFNASDTGKYDLYDANSVIGKTDIEPVSTEYITVIKDGAGVGRIRILPANTMFIGTMGGLQANKSDLNFIYALLSKFELGKEYSGSTIPHIYFKDYGYNEYSVPTIKEQKVIGSYFAEIDRLITFHQSNYEKMTAIRKSMPDKLFPQGNAKVPEIRFEGFVRNWEKKPLGAIVIPYSNPVEVPHDGYERLGIRSYGKGVFHEYVEAGKEITTAQLHRVAAHNFIVNITFAWEHAVAVTCDSDAGKLVSHRFPQFSMTDGIHDQFLKYLILDARFRHHLLLSSPGGAGRNRMLKIPEMLEYEMMIPDIEEQKQIAGYLNSLDDLIELYRIQTEKLKNIKAACLQGMFV